MLQSKHWGEYIPSIPYKYRAVYNPESFTNLRGWENINIFCLYCKWLIQFLAMLTYVQAMDRYVLKTKKIYKT